MTSSRTLLLGLEENLSSSNRFSEDLTQIDSEESELNKKINETENELEYIEQVLRKYMGLKESLKEKLQNLETQRKNCLMRRDTLMATHNVFGSPTNDSNPIFGSSLSLESTTSILLGKGRRDFLLKEPNGINGTSANHGRATTPLTDDYDVNSLNLDLSEMVSGLFRSESTPYNGSSAMAATTTISNINSNGHLASNGSSSFVEPLPLLSFSRVISRDSCSTPSSAFGDGAPLGSSIIGSHPNGTATSSRSNSSLSPMSVSRLSKELEDVVTRQTSSLAHSNSCDFPLLNSNNQCSNNNANANHTISNGNSNFNTNSSSTPIGNSNGNSNFHHATSNGIGGGNNLNCFSREVSPTPSSFASQTTNATTNNSTLNRQVVLRPQNGTGSPPMTMIPGQPRMAVYNAVLSIEASSTGFVYKSLADKSVVRYRFGNVKDTCLYPGHTDKVKVLCLDQQNQHFLYTGCDDGRVRCYKADSGSLIAEYQCEGSVICLEKGWDCLIVGTNKGWIYLFKNQFSQLIASHRVFNWICALKPLVAVQGRELRNKKTIVVLPMKHKPTLIDAMDGKILREIGSAVIDSKPCIQVNGSIVIIATVTDKSDPGKSVISIYDASNDWSCLQRLTRDGIIAALRTCGHELYVGVKFPSYGHIQCLKWANKSLALKWIACVAYVNCLAVLPNDVVLNGGPDGSVYNTTPNLKGPFLCTNQKCKCKQPFARRKDLEFHYSKVAGTVSITS